VPRRQLLDARQVGEVRHGARQRGQRADRLARQVEQAAAEQLPRARDLVAEVVVLASRHLVAPLGAEVEQDAEDLRARHAVDDRVVDLGQHRHAPLGQAVDDVELPQRVRAIERPRDDACDLLGERMLVARRRGGGLADVEVEVEVLVLDPVRVVQAERHLGQAPAEGRQQVQALADEPADVLAGQSAPGAVDGS
jgi:hypothetical protein